MSTELEAIENNIFDNRIPEAWKKNSYPSLKPLGGWISDLIDRINFISDWLIKG